MSGARTAVGQFLPRRSQSRAAEPHPITDTNADGGRGRLLTGNPASILKIAITMHGSQTDIHHVRRFERRSRWLSAWFWRD
jgi:hypothetical protein